MYTKYLLALGLLEKKDKKTLFKLFNQMQNAKIYTLLSFIHKYLFVFFYQQAETKA